MEYALKLTLFMSSTFIKYLFKSIFKSINTNYLVHSSHDYIMATMGKTCNG